MADTSNALRQTSDELLRDLQDLATLEDEKRAIPPGDPRLLEMAEQIEAIATRVLTSSTRQRALTEEIQEQVEAGERDAPVRTIEETPRPIAAVLADWREAERRAGAAEPGTAEAREAELLVEQLREEYRRAHDQALRPDRG